MKQIISLAYSSLKPNEQAMKQNSVEQLIYEFFEIYETQSPLAAMQYAFSTNSYFTEDDEGVGRLTGQLKGILQIVGNYCSHEKTAERSLGNKLKLMTYLAYYDRQPLRFTFELYKPRDQWFFLHVSFDDKYSEDLKNSVAVPHPSF